MSPAGLRLMTFPSMLACTAGLAGCGMLGGSGAPDRPATDVPGPFEQAGIVELCMDGTRLDGPSGPGVSWTGDRIGFCVGAEAVPRACEADPECGTRERCVCGTCRVPLCRTGDDCPAGLECSGHDHRCRKACASDVDCPGDARCDPATLGCAAPCGSDLQCAFGEVCSTSRGLCTSIECGASGCGAGRRCDTQRRTAVVTRPAFDPGSGATMWMTVEGTGIVRFSRRAAAWTADPGQAVLDARLRDPSVAPDDRGGLVMVAGTDGGTALHAFSSADGVGWSPLEDDGSFLVPAETWEAGWIGRPSAIPDGDGWIVAYEGGPGNGIGMARLTRPCTGARLTEHPAIEASNAGTAPFWSWITSVGAPHLFAFSCAGERPWTGILFEASGLERMEVTTAGAEPPLANSSVGFARLLRDGTVEVDPANPMFTTYAGIGVTRGEHTPAISCEGGAWSITYTASDPRSGGSEGLFRALPY